MDYIVTGKGVPRTVLADRVPLFHCAVELDVRKSEAMGECILSYARYSVGDRYARKSGATEERMIAYARHGVRDRYACKA